MPEGVPVLELRDRAHASRNIVVQEVSAVSARLSNNLIHHFAALDAVSSFTVSNLGPTRQVAQEFDVPLLSPRESAGEENMPLKGGREVLAEVFEQFANMMCATDKFWFTIMTLPSDDGDG